MSREFDSRQLAFEVLAKVERAEIPATQAIDEALSRTYGIDPRDRALITELVYGVQRHRRRLDRALSAFCRKPLHTSHPLVVRALRVAVYQLLFMDRVPARAAVHGVVEYVGHRLGKRPSGFVNAVLRSFLRKGEPPLPSMSHQPRRYLREVLSYSDWMAELFEDRLGMDGALELGAALDKRYKTVLRANSLKSTRDKLTTLLSQQGVKVEPCRWAPQGLRVDGLKDPTRHPLHEGGHYSVQEEGSQLVSFLLEPQADTLLLDACGGAGGKTLHLADLSGDQAEIVCCDAAAWRLRKAAERYALATGRKGLETQLVDWTEREAPLREGGFEGVLLDAPCTGTGALRRHPEAKWRLDGQGLSQMVRLQEALLSRVAREVAPGGVFVYAVCSITREEGPDRVEAFLQSHPGFSRAPHLSDDNPVKPLIDAKAQLVLWPHEHGTDGFYAARLRRTIS